MSSSSTEDPAWWHNRQRKVRFDERKFDAFVRRAGREVAGGREFAVVIGSDSALRKANLQFRGEAKATDVLSFPDGEDGRLGDILISAARAQRQAEQFGHRVEDELKILLLHGLLHLLGYDHENDDGLMKRLEAEWRRKLGLRSGLTERVA